MVGFLEVSFFFQVTDIHEDFQRVQILLKMTDIAEINCEHKKNWITESSECSTVMWGSCGHILKARIKTTDALRRF
jgi:hypothetical protein